MRKINDGLTRHQRYYAKNKDCPEFKARKARNQKEMKDSGSRFEYTQKNRAVINSNAALYRARKLNQTPEDADMDAIKEIYETCPDGWHVDHIVPLSKGGLHHQDNLQHLTALDNLSKGNRL